MGFVSEVIRYIEVSIEVWLTCGVSCMILLSTRIYKSQVGNFHIEQMIIDFSSKYISRLSRQYSNNQFSINSFKQQRHNVYCADYVTDPSYLNESSHKQFWNFSFSFSILDMWIVSEDEIYRL